MSRDEEGLSLLDEWWSDSSSDNVYISLSNGLYGSGLVFNVPSGGQRTDTIHGWSTFFSDENPPVKYPTRKVRGLRVECGPSL